MQFQNILILQALSGFTQCHPFSSDQLKKHDHL